jgi:arylsulfatase A
VTLTDVTMRKHALTLLLAGIVALVITVPAAVRAEKLPNIVIILADDLGYGDLDCYGHPSIRTPNLDHMASEGMRFTDFYVAATVCTPSRAALLTGRLPIRSGMSGDLQHRVQTKNSPGGLPPEEITIARALRMAGRVARPTA